MIASTKRPRGRFKTEAEIIAAIDECHAESKRIGEEADNNELTAKELFKNAPNEKNQGIAAGMINRGKTLLTEAKKMRKREASLIDGKAKRLGAKLSEFRTKLLGVGVGDESVSK